MLFSCRFERSVILYGYIERIISVKRQADQCNIRQLCFQKTTERTLCNADDRCILLCENSGRSNCWPSASSLPLHRRRRQRKSKQSPVIYPASRRAQSGSLFWNNSLTSPQSNQCSIMYSINEIVRNFLSSLFESEAPSLHAPP